MLVSVCSLNPVRTAAPPGWCMFHRSVDTHAALLDSSMNGVAHLCVRLVGGWTRRSMSERHPSRGSRHHRFSIVSSWRRQPLRRHSAGFLCGALGGVRVSVCDVASCFVFGAPLTLKGGNDASEWVSARAARFPVLPNTLGPRLSCRAAGTASARRQLSVSVLALWLLFWGEVVG